MPAKSPRTNEAAKNRLETLARGIRGRRLALGISTMAAAHAAGVSRVTWHRMERAESSVTMGAYVGALAVLGLDFELRQAEKPPADAMAGVLPPDRTDATGTPNLIPIQNYSQLRQLAWHVRDNFELTPQEATGLYDRYRRHLDFDQMAPDELNLYRSLEKAAQKEVSFV